VGGVPAGQPGQPHCTHPTEQISSPQGLERRGRLERAAWSALNPTPAHPTHPHIPAPMIRTATPHHPCRRDAFTLNLLEIPQGAGSGFVWDKCGHVVTNYHVVRGASDVLVRPRLRPLRGPLLPIAALPGQEEPPRPPSLLWSHYPGPHPPSLHTLTRARAHAYTHCTHTLENSPPTHPTCVQVTLVAGEEEYPAKIVGFDADKDVAVLSIDRKAQASGWGRGGTLPRALRPRCACPAV
jgi:hypothetical protein